MSDESNIPPKPWFVKAPDDLVKCDMTKGIDGIHIFSIGSMVFCAFVAMLTASSQDVAGTVLMCSLAGMNLACLIWRSR